MTERIIVALIAIAIVIATFWFLGAVTAGYSQEADPTTIAVATQVLPPYIPNEYDHTRNGVVAVNDIQQVAAHFGETGPVPVCAILLYPEVVVEWVACPAN